MQIRRGSIVSAASAPFALAHKNCGASENDQEYQQPQPDWLRLEVGEEHRYHQQGKQQGDAGPRELTHGVAILHPRAVGFRLSPVRRFLLLTDMRRVCSRRGYTRASGRRTPAASVSLRAVSDTRIRVHRARQELAPRGACLAALLTRGRGRAAIAPMLSACLRQRRGTRPLQVPLAPLALLSEDCGIRFGV